MPAKLSRRDLAALWAVVLPASAQTPAPAAAADDATAERERVKTASKTLAAFTVPMETEPAVHFKA
jgi:hypothetical protein